MSKKEQIELLELLEKKCRLDNRMPSQVMEDVFRSAKRELEKT
jgi:hypothetical protein